MVYIESGAFTKRLHQLAGASAFDVLNGIQADLLKNPTCNKGIVMKQKGKKKQVKVFGDLKQSLHEALAYEQNKRTVLRVSELPPPPKPLSPRQIRAIRLSFQVSQAVFARLINVSPNAVESWEQGVRHPREATLKLLTIAHKHPEVLLAGD